MAPPPTNLADTYAEVQSGVGFIAVQTCAGSYTGSGFLVDEERVVTAAHVIEGATNVQVEFGDEIVAASVQGVDLAIDLAVLQLERPVDHHLFRIARADPEPGTSVAVIGFPFGEPKSLTEGTISGLDREVTFGSRTYTGLLQTDAAINPGNSGGPVVSTDGSIVGMADAIRRRAQGIGFAVPVSQLRSAVEGGASLDQPELPNCQPEPSEPDPVLTGVGKTLRNHFDAINARDYRLDMRQFSAEIRADNTPEQWYDDYATTYDDQLRIHRVTGPPTNPLVSATFRSRQDPGYGPTGAEDATCLIWSIEYDMTRQGDRWVISGVDGVGDPPWTRCD
ncbi:MAG: S1C family serine protease [Nocardioidaceae bacterium]